MSNERKLLVYRDSKLVQEISLTGESLSIGREDSCEVVLDSESVSRVHAKIVVQEASLYLENQSSTGQLFIDTKQVEFAEWNENQEAKIGPFVLKWTFGEAAKAQRPKAEAPSKKNEKEAAPDAAAADAASSNFAFNNDWAQPASDQNAEALSLVKSEDSHLEVDSNDDNDEQENSDDDHESDDQPISFEVGSGNSPEVEPSFVDSSESTKLSTDDSVGLLKIVQGETIGREIKLDQGFQWIVGRSSKCHIKIDNSKLSRQHFKIVKVSGRYRVQDLGSANGTRLNGIAVTDAPLSPFDTIVSGPVEFQFLISQAHLENAPALLGGISAGQAFGSHETTQFAPPPMVYNGEGGGANPFEYAASAPQQPEGLFAGANENSAPPKSLSGKAKVWWEAQPKNKRLIYVGAAAILIALLAMPSSQDSAPSTVASNGAPNAASKTASAGPSDEQRSADISPEFYLLSPEERRKVADAYAKAQRSRNASDWKAAVEYSKDVLKYVDRYKDISDILAESQTHFNDVILGAVTKDLKNSLDADAQVQEQVTLLIDAGKKAISESRWTDAQEQCAKAVSLDPKNEEANKCYAAAYGQDANFAVAKVPEEAPLPTDSGLDLQASLEKELESKKQIYQSAQTLEQDGNLDKALDSYKFLLSQVDRELEGIALPGRYPASISSSYGEKNTELKTQIEQRMKDIFFQYETDYRTQLVDADQLIANQDYVRARETYDRILNAAPNFQDVRNKRSELYKRMISEARGIYHEALIYESVGDLQAAIEKYTQTKRLLAGIVHPTADEYFRKSNAKLRNLVP